MLIMPYQKIIIYPILEIMSQIQLNQHQSLWDTQLSIINVSMLWIIGTCEYIVVLVYYMCMWLNQCTVELIVEWMQYNVGTYFDCHWIPTWWCCLLKLLQHTNAVHYCNTVIFGICIWCTISFIYFPFLQQLNSIQMVRFARFN